MPFRINQKKNEKATACIFSVVNSQNGGVGETEDYLLLKQEFARQFFTTFSTILMKKAAISQSAPKNRPDICFLPL